MLCRVCLLGMIYTYWKFIGENAAGEGATVRALLMPVGIHSATLAILLHYPLCGSEAVNLLPELLWHSSLVAT